MPWKTSSVMEEKLRFVFEHELRERTMTELCERYEITRQTGYVWLRRYSEAGVAGLMEHSRATHRHNNQTPEALEQMVLELRQAHMRWGPRKLKRILERDEPGQSWPATSTIGALLQREGLVVPRRKRCSSAPMVLVAGQLCPGSSRSRMRLSLRGPQRMCACRNSSTICSSASGVWLLCRCVARLCSISPATPASL